MIRTTHVQRWGNSAAIRIPKPAAEALGLDRGQFVELEVVDRTLVVRPVRPIARSLDRRTKEESR